jgi:diguanylate cyclase
VYRQSILTKSPVTFENWYYLQQFPFDTLKIDACFIRNINQHQINAVITKTVIEMAHQLGLKVVAE